VDTININDRRIHRGFTIEALVCSDPDVESVEFWVNGAIERTENVPPYAIAGDKKVQTIFHKTIYQLRRWRPAIPGRYLITAVPYSADDGINGSGNHGISKVVDLWIYEGPASRSVSDDFNNPQDGLQNGIRELSEEELELGITNRPNMMVYPNPTTGDLNVEIIRVTEDDAELILLDATGKIIYRNTLETHQSEITHRLQLDDLPNGVYMIKVNIGEDVLTKRVVKE
jgi:hypothetical protein